MNIAGVLSALTIPTQYPPITGLCLRVQFGARLLQSSIRGVLFSRRFPKHARLHQLLGLQTTATPRLGLRADRFLRDVAAPRPKRERPGAPAPWLSARDLVR